MALDANLGILFLPECDYVVSYAVGGGKEIEDRWIKGSMEQTISTKELLDHITA